MTAQEIIEKIRAKIERLKGQLIRGACAAQIQMETSCKDEAYDEMLSILSDLEKEEKPSEGLEEECLNPFKLVAGCIDDTLKEKAKEVFANEIEDEINRWMGSTDCLPEDVGITPLPKVMEIVERTARHFAKWQREQMISALKNDGDLPIEFIDKFHEIDRNAFQNGQANMREQMMKEAVEGEITKDNRGNNVIRTGVFNNGFEIGDKVRLVIVKED